MEHETLDEVDAYRVAGIERESAHTPRAEASDSDTPAGDPTSGVEPSTVPLSAAQVSSAESIAASDHTSPVAKDHSSHTENLEKTS